MNSIAIFIVRFALALALGSLIGLEREYIGKVAGIRTCMMVGGGAALFVMITLFLPLAASDIVGVPSFVLAQSSGFLAIVGNIIVAVGFLGAGVVIKTGEHVHGLTTAVTMWVTAAVGILCGIGLYIPALIASLFIVGLLFLTRNLVLKNGVQNTDCSTTACVDGDSQNCVKKEAKKVLKKE